jgi:hypothetical protein
MTVTRTWSRALYQQNSSDDQKNLTTIIDHDGVRSHVGFIDIAKVACWLKLGLKEAFGLVHYSVLYKFPGYVCGLLSARYTCASGCDESRLNCMNRAWCLVNLIRPTTKQLLVTLSSDVPGTNSRESRSHHAFPHQPICFAETAEYKVPHFDMEHACYPIGVDPRDSDKIQQPCGQLVAILVIVLHL